MNTNSVNKIKRRMYFMLPFGFIFLASILMLTAGSLRYWQGWLFCVVVFIPVFFVATYFLKKNPEFLERRMMTKEKELQQKTIIKISTTLFSIGFLIPGFDYRFGWSSVPFWLVIVSNIVILISYYLVFLSYKENAFAGRTVEIFEGQKVIDTGPYSVIRHPMYAGVIPLFLFIPLALGSFWAITLFIPVCITIIPRILNEEKVLRKDLPGYNTYCKKVRYRLIPFVW